MSEKVIVVIPARFASVRFPGKVLADLKGKPIIQWVYEKAKATKADDVYVAVDTPQVAEAVEAFGGKAVMTREDHPSGSDRIWEAASAVGGDIIINIQGDEPLIPSDVVDELIYTMLEDKSVDMGTVAVKVPRERLENDPNKVKVVFGEDGKALYFSRSMIPYLREGGEDTDSFLHWGLYAYRREALEKFVSLPEGRLEKCEKLEQLRALENGISIKVILSEVESIGVDTPEDLAEAEKKLTALGL